MCTIEQDLVQWFVSEALFSPLYGWVAQLVGCLSVVLEVRGSIFSDGETVLPQRFWCFPVCEARNSASLYRQSKNTAIQPEAKLFRHRKKSNPAPPAPQTITLPTKLLSHTERGTVPRPETFARDLVRRCTSSSYPVLEPWRWVRRESMEIHIRPSWSDLASQNKFSEKYVFHCGP